MDLKKKIALPVILLPVMFSFLMVMAGCSVALGAFNGTFGSAPGSQKESDNKFSGDCTAKRIETRAQYTQGQFNKIFGPPRSKELQDKLKDATLLGKKTTTPVHEKVAACIEAASKEMEAKNVSYKITEFGGYRASDAQIGDRSYHVYGAAVDINWTKMPYGSTTHDFPKEFEEIMKSHGFYWGFDFSRTKDPHHWEWHGEKP